MRAVSNRLSAYTQPAAARALLGKHRDLYGVLQEFEPQLRRRLLACDHVVYGEDAQMMEGMNMPAILEGKVALVTGAVAPTLVAFFEGVSFPVARIGLGAGPLSQ
jgi:hypothetical protein